MLRPNTISFQHPLCDLDVIPTVSPHRGGFKDEPAPEPPVDPTPEADDAARNAAACGQLTPAGAARVGRVLREMPLAALGHVVDACASADDAVSDHLLELASLELLRRINLATAPEPDPLAAVRSSLERERERRALDRLLADVEGASAA